MTDVVVMTVYSEANNVIDTTSSSVNEWVVYVPADPSAPVLGSRWKAHVLFASVKGFVPNGSRRVIGILSDGFRGGLNGDMALLASEVAVSSQAADYSVINQQNYLPVKNPHLLRDGGSFRVRVCHLDTASPYTIKPTVGDWTLVLRFEMLGSKTRT